VFRLCATDSATSAAAAGLCRRLGIGRLAVIADATAYGIGLAERVGRAALEAGVEVTVGLGGAAAVFHAMGEVEQAEAIRAARAAGFAGALLGAEGGPGAALAALAGPAAEGAWQLSAGTPAASAATVYAAEAEDAAHLLASAVVAAGEAAGARAAAGGAAGARAAAATGGPPGLGRFPAGRLCGRRWRGGGPRGVQDRWRSRMAVSGWGRRFRCGESAPAPRSTRLAEQAFIRQSIRFPRAAAQG
jgi:hypothetical protein